MQRAIEFLPEEKFIHVDEWIPEEEDMIFNQTKGAILLPVSDFYNVREQDKGMLDAFVLSSSRCYNSDKMREHFVQYLNYFLKFYDSDKELLSIYFRIKYLIDYEKAYSKEAFMYDIDKYIISNNLLYKVRRMNNDNYKLKLVYKYSKNPVLQYNDEHALALMEISILMVILIPLLTHFIYKNNVVNVKTFLLETFDKLIFMHSSIDIYSKLYETVMSIVNRSAEPHKVLWGMQAIRGKNPSTLGIYTVNNIIRQIIPKYTYADNIICYNYRSILRTLDHQIIDIGYEYNFISLSSSKRDEDFNSEFDKFESHLIKQNEALYIQNKVNCEETMKTIERLYGPFEPELIEFYKKELTRDGKPLINSFQKELIFNLFYKYFGDPISIDAINATDYIKLMIAAKRILDANRMVILPYIISSRVTRLVTRKNINKKEMTKLNLSPFYSLVQKKYNNPKIEKYILSIIAQILSSEFKFIEPGPENKELNGEPIPFIPDYICEEILLYVTLI